MADSRAPAGSVTESLINAVRSRFPGTMLLSGYRKNSITVTGNKSMHSKEPGGHAVDLPPKREIFEWIAANYGAQSHELIFSPMGDKQIYRGKSHVYTGVVKATHYDHIHWSMVTAPGAGGTVPVALPSPTTGVPSLDTVDKVKSFFSEQNGARRLVFMVVGVGMIWVGVNVAVSRQVAGVVSGAIGR